MSDDTPAELQQLVNAIKQNTTWSGQAMRELRDQIDGASKQVAKLAQVGQESVSGLQGELARLTAAIEAGGQRAERLRRAVWLLIEVVAVGVLALVGLAWLSRY